MRKKRAIINIVFSIALQLVSVISGLIIPRLFISSFGSEVNGLINSITSFVSYITLLQTGVGSAIKASLYRPLANKNYKELYSIIKTSDEFFKKIALATVIYLFILIIIYPVTIANEFDWVYTASLILIIGVSTAAQYFFGITYQMLLEADQLSYIYSIIQIFTVILNTIFVIITIRLGFSVQLVKLSSSFFFVARPILLRQYTKSKYKINFNVETDYNLIDQRWDAFAHGIAYFIHTKTDIFVLSVFASFIDVSIYTVYSLVTTGLSSVIDAIDKAVRSAFGNIIANNEKKNLEESFTAYNNLFHMFITAIFSTAIVTIFSFINVYLKNVSDANYYKPKFGLILLTAEMIKCLRLPYNSIIFAAGKFKETKKEAALEAFINLVISCALVNYLGIEGVAIGTLIAMIYRTITFIKFLRKNIIRLSVVTVIKRYIITFINYYLAITIFSRVKYIPVDFVSWFIYAFKVFMGVSLITLAINTILDYDSVKKSIRLFFTKKK